MYIFVLEGQRIQSHILKFRYWREPIRERITTRGLILDDNLKKKVCAFPEHPIQQILYECGYVSVRFEKPEIGRLLNGFILEVEKESEAIWLKMKPNILRGLRISEIYKFKNFEYLEEQDKKLKAIEQQLFLLDRLVRMQEEAEHINEHADEKYTGLLNPNIKQAIKSVSQANFDCHPLYTERKKIKRNIKRYIKRRLIV